MGWYLKAPPGSLIDYSRDSIGSMKIKINLKAGEE